MSIAEALVADFKQELEHSRKVLQAVPEDNFDWKPHEKSMSLAQLAGHVAETPAWTHEMVKDEFDLGASMDGYQPFAPSSHSELMAALEKNASTFVDLLTGMSDERMTGTWTMRMGDDVVMAAPRHAAIRSVILHHTAHHRGQLTVYLRLLDVPVPATYGPTADQPAFA